MLICRCDLPFLIDCHTHPLQPHETTFPSVSYDLPDLSATFTNINLEGNFHPGQSLFVEVATSGDPGHIRQQRYFYIYKSSGAETPLLKTPEAGNDQLQSLKSNNYSIAVLLTNSRHVSPYTEKTQVTLNINILGAPILKTGSAASISSNSAALDAVINPSGNTTSGYFEYGLTTDYGSTAPLSQSQLTGFLPVQVVAQLIDLQPNTTYHYRIRATNTLGETIGEDKSFKTLATTNLPTTATLDASDVTAYTAVLNGTINPNGITSYGEFEYGTTTAYGSFGLIYQNPVQGNQPVAVSYALQNLVSGQTYHFRLNAYHQGHTDVVHGEDKTFVTIAGGVQVGQEYQGGIVMSVEPNGIHGRIAAPADLGPATGTPWGCYHTEIAGADGVVYGTGQQNTADIVAGCPDQDIAAKLCDDLVLNGYSDWYLPSQHELFSLYSARDLVGGFNPAGWYWSSSEISADEAFILRFNDGLSGHMYKDYKLLVRAIRSF